MASGSSAMLCCPMNSSFCRRGSLPFLLPCRESCCRKKNDPARSGLNGTFSPCCAALAGAFLQLQGFNNTHPLPGPPHPTPSGLEDTGPGCAGRRGFVLAWRDNGSEPCGPPQAQRLSPACRPSERSSAVQPGWQD